jgi:hypothetical protein
MACIEVVMRALVFTSDTFAGAARIPVAVFTPALAAPGFS